MPISEIADLPTPAQMAALERAQEAARQARRMVDASRALITGNIAFAICLGGACLTLMHSGLAGENAPFVLCGLVYGYLLGAFFVFRWLKHRLKANPVTIVTRQEEASERAIATEKSITVFLPLFAMIFFMVITTIGWSIAFRSMSNGAILAALALTPILGIGFFVVRFGLYQFWEDLLFAGCVLLAFLPFFLRFLANLDLPWLSFVSLPIVVFGAVCLQVRWETWAWSIAADISERDPAEGQP